jgi:hypothetical protein
MKRVDMDTVVVVHSGEQWEHEQPPCSRQMIRYLEKNEGLVTWVQVDLLLSWRVSGRRLIQRVQPKGGAVKDQYPVLRIHGECYTMSLRMMKAVWFVRLPPFGVSPLAVTGVVGAGGACVCGGAL